MGEGHWVLEGLGKCHDRSLERCSEGPDHPKAMVRMVSLILRTNKCNVKGCMGFKGCLGYGVGPWRAGSRVRVGKCG